MNSPIALLIAPHCTDPSSDWFSPGRSSKLSNVLDLLKICGFETALINTCPVKNIKPFENEVQLSQRNFAFFRLLDFLIRPRKLAIPTPSIIWVYNSRMPEAIAVWSLRQVYPRLMLSVELEDLPAARRVNASWRGWIDWFSTKWLLRRASFVTCVSPKAAEVLRDCALIPRTRLKILPPLLNNGFLEAIKNRGNPPFTRRFIRILYAGGYSPEKGVEDLLWAFAFLPSSRFRLHLAGPASFSIRHLASQMPHIYVHGSVDQNHLHSLYQHADVVVNPHREILNGNFIFPFKTIEQVASGALPLLSTSLQADTLGLPKALLFSNKEQLLELISIAPYLWQTHHQRLEALAGYLRKNYSVEYVASQCSHWINDAQSLC